jgi:hypothetical protein
MKKVFGIADLTAENAKNTKFGKRQFSMKARREDISLPNFVTFVPSW